MFVEDILSACRRVVAGDEDALHELGLDNLSYPRPSLSYTSAVMLQIHYNSALNTAVAARELQFGFTEKQWQLALELMEAIAVKQGIELDHHIDGQDIAEIMMALIDYQQQRMRSMHSPSTNVDHDSDEESTEHPTVKGSANDDVHDIPP